MAEGKFQANEIAKFYLSKSSMTPKKLQKILYFAYSWYLALMNEDRKNLDTKLFDGNFEAWIHGPVYPSIYQEYKSYRADLIPQKEYNLVNLTTDEEEVLNEVWNVYGKYTANELESISHQHNPWKETRMKSNCNDSDWCNSTISDELIFDYYTSQLVEA